MITRKLLSILAVLCFFGAANVSTIFAEPANSRVQTINVVNRELKPGSLLIHQGDCLAVKIYTRSSYTHVAIVMPDNQQGWMVYDSANGKGVRKISLADYLLESPEDKISLYHLAQNLTPKQIHKLKQSLEEEMGRPYAVKHYLTGNRAKGVHCSQYVTESLMAINILRANKPARVSPVSLLEGIVQAKIYQAGTTITYAEPAKQTVSEKEKSGWCSRAWQQTKSCTHNCYIKAGRLFACGG